MRTLGITAEVAIYRYELCSSSYVKKQIIKTERQTSSKTLRFYGSEFIYKKEQATAMATHHAKETENKKQQQWQRQRRRRRQHQQNDKQHEQQRAKAHAHNFINETRMAKEQSIYFLII